MLHHLILRVGCYHWQLPVHQLLASLRMSVCRPINNNLKSPTDGREVCIPSTLGQFQFGPGHAVVTAQA